MEGKNTEDIIPLARLTKDIPVNVRFIEEMPFNGTQAHHPGLLESCKDSENTLKEVYPDIKNN